MISCTYQIFVSCYRKKEKSLLNLPAPAFVTPDKICLFFLNQPYSSVATQKYHRTESDLSGWSFQH